MSQLRRWKLWRGNQGNFFSPPSLLNSIRNKIGGVKRKIWRKKFDVKFWRNNILVFFIFLLCAWNFINTILLGDFNILRKYFTSIDLQNHKTFLIFSARFVSSLTGSFLGGGGPLGFCFCLAAAVWCCAVSTGGEDTPTAFTSTLPDLKQRSKTIKA